MKQVTKLVKCEGVCVRQSVMVTECGVYALMKQVTEREGREGEGTDEAGEECLRLGGARV